MWMVPLDSPSVNHSGIKAPFDKGYDRGSRFVKQQRQYKQCWSVCDEPSNGDKSFRLKGEHDELMDSHLRGSVIVYKCELYVPHRIKE
ncbi:hypothetical protein MTR_2g095360 [Medicago truncatula]|uniref:Uncharacterized protein n=1 Tax=Medicago truncatula TaxID=3880 RepID=G8A157_MEDTR|nr:hypothetical protein MTR_2g095360 [Medicago truncatula]